MKILSKLRVWTFLSVSLLLISAKLTDPGIRVKEVKAKSTVYEIKIKSMTSETQGLMLDSRFISKSGILSAHTDFASRICTVEAIQVITRDQLRGIVEMAGLEISKSFD